MVVIEVRDLRLCLKTSNGTGGYACDFLRKNGFGTKGCPESLQEAPVSFSSKNSDCGER